MQGPTAVGTDVLGPILACFGPSGCRDQLQKMATFLVWLDRATIQFRFIGPAARTTGRSCVFGPVLRFELSSSWRRLPGYGASTNRNVLDFMRWPHIDLGS
jgi:hypothetical protein